MSKHNHAPLVLFGAEQERANKALISYKDPLLSAGITVSCFELTDDTDYKQGCRGEIHIDKDVSGLYFSMHFCNKSALRNMIDYLEEVERDWDNLIEERTDDV